MAALTLRDSTMLPTGFPRPGTERDFDVTVRHASPAGQVSRDYRNPTEFFTALHQGQREGIEEYQLIWNNTALATIKEVVEQLEREGIKVAIPRKSRRELDGATEVQWETVLAARRKLRCPGCGSPRVVPHAERSRLDGKHAYHCTACQLELSPLRSRFLLWFLLSASVLLGLACPVGVITLGVLIAKAPPNDDMHDAIRGVLVLGGATIAFAGFARAAFGELRKPTPTREH